MKPTHQTSFGTIYGDVEIVPLTDVAFFQEGPGLRNWQWTDDGMKVINGRNILLDYSIDLANTDKYIALEEFHKTYSHFAVEAGDIVVTSSGTIGKVARINASHLPLMMNTSVIRFHPLDHERLDVGYLYAFLRSEYFQNQAESFAIGAAQRNFGPVHLKQMKVPVPPLPTQRKIASILSAYDDLIENNTRRIAILEEMAQAIYREWFVNFRFPGHENVKLVDSPLGQIPEGWEATTVKKLVKRIQSGKKYNNKTVVPEGSVPVLDQGKSGIIGYHDDEPGLVASEENPVIVFANHTCYQRIIHYPFSAIQNVLPFVPHPDAHRNLYWLHWATKDVISFNDYKGHWPEFMAKQIVLPLAKLCETFGDIARDHELSIFSLQRRNEKLRSSRDLILPKLISGKLDLEDLDIDVGLTSEALEEATA